MTKNWSPMEVANKNCRDCRKVIWLDKTKHKFFDDPELTLFHRCEKWRPNKDAAVTSEQVDHISRQLISIESDIVMLRKAIHEIGQAVFEIRGKVI